MTRHSHEMMKYFIEMSKEPLNEDTGNYRFDIAETPDDMNDILLEKVKEVISKLDSYYQEGSYDYMTGLQDGLNYGIEILSKLVESMEDGNEF